MVEMISHARERADMGFLRVAVVTPEVRIADVDFNVAQIVQMLGDLATQECQLALFPELAVTSYSCGDLFFQRLLLDRARSALLTVARATKQHPIACVVGAPLEVDGRLYNCAALINGGVVVGIVPKTYLPSTNEYYEERWFASSLESAVGEIVLGDAPVPFGNDLLFQVSNIPHCTVGIEICEDLWAPNPPSGGMAIAGATILLNPSASDELLGKANYRRQLVQQQSARCLAAYLYAGAGPGESTTDMVFGGHSLIAENGVILAETGRFAFASHFAICDIDVESLVHDRLKSTTFSSAPQSGPYRKIVMNLSEPGLLASGRVADESAVPALLRPQVVQLPFVPASLSERAQHCEEVFSIQSTGLAKRLKHTGSRHIIIGVSGGLDSTLALLVATRAVDVLRLPRASIIAITMPGFGTSSRTKQNAHLLAMALDLTFREISIESAVRQHFADIAHDEGQRDITYENAQARERTQILMDIANQAGGLVVGTGDLSEFALGWCTYNGDQMSMYHVNAGVPKTLVRYLVEWCADSLFLGAPSDVLRDICNTPITPELLPLGEDGVVQQRTEDIIGPYELHDFLLFYTARYGFSPRKVFLLASHAFRQVYTADEILRWMGEFYGRFFMHQFKRSAMPDAPKVGSVALSPRADWRMPSDASAALWQQELADMRTTFVDSAGGTLPLRLPKE